jgi:hypothetical protein
MLEQCDRDPAQVHLHVRAVQRDLSQGVKR